MNKIYRAIETGIVFKDSGGDAAITLQNLASSGLRISARYDRGAGSLPSRYRWRAVFQWAGTPIIGQYIEIFLAESDGTYADGTVGTSNASMTGQQTRNLKYLGRVVNYSTTGASNMVSSGECDIFDRYFSVGVHNKAANALQNTSNVSFIMFYAIPDEIQG